MSRLLASAALLLVCASTSPATAIPFRLVYHGHTVTISAAAVPVVPADGSGWAGITATPAAQGSPIDYGYANQAIARFDTVPFQTIGAGQTLHIGVLAFHQATVVEQAVGALRPVAGSNIARVSLSVDGGPWSDATVATVNADSGVLEYSFDARANDFTDGPHEARAIIYPATGTPLVLQGASRAFGAIGSMSGTTLTFTDLGLQAGGFSAGQTVAGVGVADGTYITGACSDNGTNTTCPISISQTVASTALRIGATAGLFFTTNAGASKPSLVRYAGPAGTDGSSCGTTSSAPCLTANKAMANLNTAQIAAGGDGGGGTVCLQAGTYASFDGAFSYGSPYASDRWLTLMSSGHGPCDSVNAGTATLQAVSADLGIKLLRVAYLNVTPTSTAGSFTQTGNVPTAIWLDHVTYAGLSYEQGEVIHVSSFSRGIFCTESSITNVENGCSDALLARNMTESWMASDAFQDVHMIVNSTVTYDTPSPGVGDLVSGSPILRNFAGAPHLVAGDCLYNATYLPDSTCILSVDSATQVTFNKNAIATGNGVRVDAGTNAAHDEHPDIWQSQGFMFNQIAYGLDAGSLTINSAQGLFPSNAYNLAVVNSRWQNAGGNVANMTAPSKNWLLSGNNWNGNLIWANTPWADVLQYHDVCSVTGSRPAGITLSGSPTC